MSPAISYTPEVELIPHLLRRPFRQMVGHDVRMTISTDYITSNHSNAEYLSQTAGCRF